MSKKSNQTLPRQTETDVSSVPLLFVDYNGSKEPKDFLEYKEKLEGLERRLHNIESLLWDNRDKYTSSLDIVANREIEICKALDETKKLLRENRELYTQAFNRLFSKEELLEEMLKEAKEILTSNRQIYLESMLDLERKNNESIERIRENTPIFLGPRAVLNPYLNRNALSVSSPSSDKEQDKCQ